MTVDKEGNGWYLGKLSQNGTPSEDNDLVTLNYLKEYIKTCPSSKGITPSNCTNLVGVYDKDLNRNKMKFKESEDIVIIGNTICSISYVQIVKNNDHIPSNPDDGIVIETIYKEDFNKHINSFYIDETTEPQLRGTWYYKLFPFSSEGIYTSDDANTIIIEAKPYSIYGFTIDQNESDPLSNITYIEDNANFAPAYMNYNTEEFDYGDWEGAWFIKNLKPCRLNSDGTVAYELNPNDYSLKADGTPSDITDSGVDGNIMVGIPKVYYKMTQNEDGTTSYRFSDVKIDDEYQCYAHIDANGNEIPYAYQPAYNGSLIDDRLRSLSGRSAMKGEDVINEIAYATANNLEDSNIWYTEVLADRMLINLLLILIGKSTNTQKTFGYGNCYNSGGGVLITGTLDKKGLFWGKNYISGTGVKVFGIENYWCNLWRRIGGYVCDNGVQKIKLTYGTQDGSLVSGYSSTGNGYIKVENSTITGSNGGCISKMIFTKYGLIPKEISGSTSTYFCDGIWFNNNTLSYALVGGDTGYGHSSGAFAMILDNTASGTSLTFGASLSCKPLAS